MKFPSSSMAFPSMSDVSLIFPISRSFDWFNNFLLSPDKGIFPKPKRSLYALAILNYKYHNILFTSIIIYTDAILVYCNLMYFVNILFLFVTLKSSF